MCVCVWYMTLGWRVSGNIAPAVMTFVGFCWVDICWTWGCVCVSVCGEVGVMDWGMIEGADVEERWLAGKESGLEQEWGGVAINLVSSGSRCFGCIPVGPLEGPCMVIKVTGAMTSENKLWFNWEAVTGRTGGVSAATQTCTCKLTSIDINGGDRLSVFSIKILMIVQACVSLLLSSLFFSSFLFVSPSFSTLCQKKKKNIGRK